MIHGNAAHDSMAALIAGVTWSRTLTVPEGQRVMRAAAFLDGLGTGASSGAAATVVGVIYAADRSLVSVGREVAVFGGQLGGWVTLGWDEPGFALPAGDYRVAVFTQAPTIVRVGTSAPMSGYAQVAASAIPTVRPTAGVTIVSNRALVLETLEARVPAVTPDDEFYATRLPRDFAQAALAVGRDGAPLGRGQAVPARCAWHGPSVDPEAGYVAIVRTGGPLEDLVGARLEVTRTGPGSPRSVLVYCHDEQAWPADLAAEEDLSLSRRAWLEIAELPLGAVDVTVRVLA